MASCVQTLREEGSDKGDERCLVGVAQSCRRREPPGSEPRAPMPLTCEQCGLVDLKGELVQRWLMTSLLDILKETDLRVDITRHFASLASGARQFAAGDMNL
jgi:hypothetical protein